MFNRANLLALVKHCSIYCVSVIPKCGSTSNSLNGSIIASLIPCRNIVTLIRSNKLFIVISSSSRCSKCILPLSLLTYSSNSFLEIRSCGPRVNGFSANFSITILKYLSSGRLSGEHTVIPQPCNLNRLVAKFVTNSLLPEPGTPVTTVNSRVLTLNSRSKLPQPVDTPVPYPCSYRSTNPSYKSSTEYIPLIGYSIGELNNLATPSLPNSLSTSLASLQPGGYSKW